MSRYLSFEQKPESLSRQSCIFKELTVSSAHKWDLKRLLELLNVTNDINLQLKVFSALSAHLMFYKGANIDVVIKCNAVYDKIQNVLSKGLLRKSAETLNFLSALLFIDAEEGGTTKKRTLALYARNLTRTSGCLSIMCEMFVNCMMYHDTWKALCQCLAVACSGCDTNQSYCSHLIPVCIEKCSPVNLDICLVLQSLMANHKRNTQLFLECNGVSIFTRDLLHYDKCLQLLTTVAQYSNASPALQQTNVLADLRDFLRLYGPHSQLGQKAIIIIKHINSSTKVVTEKDSRQNSIATGTKMNTNNILSDSDITANAKNELEETKVLIQNVVKEIFNWKQSELQNIKETEPKAIGVKSLTEKNIANYKTVMNDNKTNQSKKFVNSTRTKKSYCDVTNELSFRFLLNEDFQAPKQKYKQSGRLQINNSTRTNNKTKMHGNETKSGANEEKQLGNELSITFLQNDDFQAPKKRYKQPVSLHNNYAQLINMDDTQNNDTILYKTISGSKWNKATMTLEDFKPIFASTPKHGESVNHTGAVTSNKTVETQTKQDKYYTLKMKRRKAKKALHRDKEMKNCSLGAKFFSVINESCTTFVKTVKNIFNRKSSLKNSTSSTLSENTIVKNKRSNTHSFINYMKKRDAVLNSHWMKSKIIDRTDFSTATSCNTCNNTEVLKHKLTKDEFLKQTVKKLKLGINLYGCDFKKISKAMWPRESYMTPLVLYNLYRKLLLK